MAALLSLIAFQLTSPGCRTRSTGRTFAQANGMTGQGLGEVTSEARNEAGNPVLADGQSCRACMDASPASLRVLRLAKRTELEQTAYHL